MIEFTKLINTIPGGIALIILGVLIFIYNRKTKMTINKQDDFEPFGNVNLRGYVVSIGLILYGLLILILRIFTNDLNA